MNELIEMAKPWIGDYGARVVGVLVLVLVAWILSSWLERFVVRALGRASFDLTLTKFFGSVARWVLLVLAGLAALSIFGVETTSFAAIIAASGLAIGLAFQSTLSSFAAGIMLLVFRPFKVGDVVKTAGETGVVDEIALFNTRLDTFDNRRVILPNSAVFGSTIENVSHHPHRRADVSVGVDYGADIDETRRILESAVESVTGSLSDPAPQVVLTGLGGSSVDWEVRVWAPASQFGDVKQAAIRAVKLALDDAGIGIPFPQMDVHLDKP